MMEEEDDVMAEQESEKGSRAVSLADSSQKEDDAYEFRNEEREKDRSYQ